MKFYLIGATGRMGGEILSAAKESNDICVKGFSSKDQLAFAEAADVVIDFSSPETFSTALDLCVKNKIAFVSGTTGLKQEAFDKLKKASEAIPVLWAANTSLGVQVVKQMFQNLKDIKDWSFHISESHHIHKKDSPSGTALVLKKELESALGKTIPDCTAIRGGGIFGEHTVHIMGPSETITIQHTALSRKLFAEGALKAAKFVTRKKAGLYTMADVLKG
ncbi:MAG: 4-hydroxy-tetrahydrodipicolinate reductase [Bdellovibrionales bacterium]|nr:4-hydroxy-tetrahydrodipicolinate reductase [Bdellovibrionales bacterium]